MDVDFLSCNEVSITLDNMGFVGVLCIVLVFVCVFCLFCVCCMLIV